MLDPSNYHISQKIGPLIYERSRKSTFKDDPDVILDSADLSPDLISSAVGTFFKAKYDDPILLDQLCKSILDKYKANLNFVNGLFLKFFVERCIQLGYKNQEFYLYVLFSYLFRELDTNVIQRKISMNQALYKDIMKGRQHEGN